MLSAPSRFHSTSSFLHFFFPSLTAMVGYWATLSLNIPDFTRYAKSQDSQIVGQAFGLPVAMTLYSFIGIACTSASETIFGEPIWSPITLLGRFHQPVVALLALVAVLVATLNVNIGANVVSPSNDFSNLAPRLISFRTGGLITGFPRPGHDALEVDEHLWHLHFRVACGLLRFAWTSGRDYGRGLLPDSRYASWTWPRCITAAGLTITPADSIPARSRRWWRGFLWRSLVWRFRRFGFFMTTPGSLGFLFRRVSIISLCCDSSLRRRWFRFAWNVGVPNELSSRPERSVVEGPAVIPSSNKSTPKRNPLLCHPEQRRGICSSVPQPSNAYGKPFCNMLKAIIALTVIVMAIGSAAAQDRSYGRSVVSTPYGIVATTYVQASQAGARILEQGGSAIDAGIAANAVLGVAEPMTNGMGGDLFAIYWEASTGKLYGLERKWVGSARA